MNWHSLLKPTAPLEHVVGGSAAAVQDALRLLASDSAHACTVRFLRGPKCADRAGFFDEAAAALQFPVHFGENWDAFHDCFAELHDGVGTFVLAVLDAGSFLESPKDALGHFRDVVKASAADAAKKNRPSLRVVYQGESEALLAAKFPGAVKLS